MSCWMMSGVFNWSASNAIQSIFPRLTSFISRILEGGEPMTNPSFYGNPCLVGALSFHPCRQGRILQMLMELFARELRGRDTICAGGL